MTSYTDSLLENGKNEQQPQKQVRVHYVDWMRILLVLVVVLAHSSVTGLKGGINGGIVGNRPPNVMVDSRTWTEDDTGKGLSPLAMRWISIGRPFTLPLLFWISGASFALSFRGKVCIRLGKSLLWIFLYTALGLAFNAVVVLNGPHSEQQMYTCTPGKHDSDVCQGRLWDFQVWPWTSTWGAIQFQMWYTMYLAVLVLVNWPLLCLFFMERKSKFFASILSLLQWLLSIGLYMVFLHMSSALCKEPRRALLTLAVYEFAFIIMSLLAVTEFREAVLPPRLVGKVNVRLVHYALAIITWLQFSTTPFAERIPYFSMSAVFYIFVGFSKYFALGFIMLRARIGPPEDDARPIMSAVWPLVVVILTVTAPTSNWNEAGYLTYPFYPRVSDRMLFIAHGLVVTFCLERVGKLANEQCIPVPNIVNRAGLLLFLMHPLFLAIVISLGVDDVLQVWLSSSALSLLLAAVLTVLTYVPRGIKAIGAARN